MATEATETVDKEVVRLKLCRFCGNEPKIRPDSQIQRVNCRNRSCAIFGVAIPIRFWNATAPNARQRAERAARRIWDDYELAGKVTIAAVADIIAAEFEK